MDYNIYANRLMAAVNFLRVAVDKVENSHMTITDLVCLIAEENDVEPSDLHAFFLQNFRSLYVK